MRSVIRSFLRHLVRRRSLSILQLLGIALGVAATVGMMLASRSALQSLGTAVDFLKGGTTHTIARPAGPMEETVLAGIMGDPAVRYFAPVIDRRVRLKGGEQVRMLGLDPFLDRNVRSITARIGVSAGDGKTDEAFSSFLFDSRAVLVDENMAKDLGLSAGSIIATLQGPLKVVQVFSNPSGEPLVIIDVGHAQEFFRMKGYVDRADLVVTDENAFRQRWATGFAIESNAQKARTLSALLGAFKLNLEALSLFALFVGIFLIYNTAMFAVVTRRRDAGVLLAIGASRGQVTGAFLVEVLLLGVAGGALGGVLGYLLSKFLVEIVGSTISTLYFFLRPSALPWSFWNLAGGMLLGSAASIVGSLPPLLELRRVRPVHVLRGRTATRGMSKRMGTIALFGTACLAFALVLFGLSFLHVYVGFAGAFAFLLGASLFAGFVIVVAAPGMKHLFSRAMGLAGRIAIGNIRENLGRTSVAVAAFMIALSMSIGLGSMIDSFRRSLVWWMDSQLRGDLYISTKADVNVPEELYEELKTLPGIGGIDVFRNVPITFHGRPASITSIDASVLERYDRFGWLEGGDGSWERMKRGDVIVSESFSRRFKVGQGSRVTIETARGPAEFLVAGVYYDYASEHGVIMMDRSVYLRLFGDRTINSLGIFIDEGNPDRVKIIEEVKHRARAFGLPFATREEFHGRILDIFDSTFAVTRSMRVLAVIVAFFGIAGALMTFFVERQKEFGVYRALGFTTGDVARMTVAESLGLGLVSFLMSAVVGTVFALILIKVINLQSFNWTIFYHFTTRPYLVTGLTALAASVAACAYPVWSVVRKYPVMQIREE
ncbi:MAG: outer membrane-specific lipoprotein transporter subunit LolE [Syntrophorhabdus sp. PtaB.Bin047]|nr:MAG: outer membrane-specific lipoprotein transporter subunit LolE [Syntrophorhabdus sp. PtaB.Bin047]